MKTLDLLSGKIKLGFFKYFLGLVLTREKKTCRKMAMTLSICHDFLYRFLLKASSFLPLLPSVMISIAKNHATAKNFGYLIIDETFFSKQFASLLAGVYNMFNAAMRREERGMMIVVMTWNNGFVTIPIAFKWMFHKDVDGKNHKTKSELAEELLLEYKDKIPFNYLLIDGHYSTEYLEKLIKTLGENDRKAIYQSDYYRKNNLKKLVKELIKMSDKNKKTILYFKKYKLLISVFF